GVLIDGTTQPEYIGLPIIAINGSGAGNITAGLVLATSGQIQGLVIQNIQGTFPQGNGIQTSSNAGESFIGNCYIGTNFAGTAAAANGGFGIDVEGTSPINIGGILSTEANLISSNASEGIHVDAAASSVFITGNSVGTNASGDAAIPNGNGVRFTGASTGNL